MDEGAAERRVVNELVERVPQLRPAYEEHLDDNDELLPHVFFGDVSRYAEALYAKGSRDELQRLLDFLEAAWEQGPEEVEELIQVSFIENVGPWEAGKAGMRDQLGPNLREAWRHYE